MEFSVNLIQQGQKDGSIREGNPIVLTTAFFIAIQGIAENIARTPEWTVDIIRRHDKKENEQAVL